MLYESYGRGIYAVAKARSPGYPAIGLKEAVERVRAVYQKDFQNRLPRAVIANHMGYKGLSGASLPVLAAMGQYGLLEGRGDETRVSDLALKIIAHEPGVAERLTALNEAAVGPELFSELHKKFPDGKASDAAIKSYLLINKFIPAAADTSLRAYRETIELLIEEEQAYNNRNLEAAFQVEMTERFVQAVESGQNPLHPPFGGQKAKPPQSAPQSEDVLPIAMRREVITLDEGDVVITFPEDLSAESFGDLKDHLDLFIKKMQRRASKKSDVFD
jgi:hypothetical protein